VAQWRGIRAGRLDLTITRPPAARVKLVYAFDAFVRITRVPGGHWAARGGRAAEGPPVTPSGLAGTGTPRVVP